jgi:hypothetical protein
MRWLKRIVLILLAFAGLFALYWTWFEIKLHRFYAARPVLSTMNAAHGGAWNGESPTARKVLLDYLPFESAERAVIDGLSAEGFSCQESPLKYDKGINCQLIAPARLGGEIRWIIDLDFNAFRRLRDARIVYFKIML